MVTGTSGGGQTCDQVAKHLQVAIGPARAAGVRSSRINPAAQFKKLSGTMFVSGHRRTEGELAQVLQPVIELIKRRIAAFPQSVAAGKTVRREQGRAPRVIH